MKRLRFTKWVSFPRTQSQQVAELELKSRKSRRIDLEGMIKLWSSEVAGVRPKAEASFS